MDEKISFYRIVEISAIIILATVAVIQTSLIIKLQTPKPELLLIVEEKGIASCNSLVIPPYGVSVKVANVGTRPSIDTRLTITYDEPNSFFDAFFAEEKRQVNITNPNYPAGWFHPLPTEFNSQPYWLVEEKNTTIILNDLSPGEIVDLHIRFRGKCGTSKQAQFFVKEKGYSESSDIKKATIIWFYDEKYDELFGT